MEDLGVNGEGTVMVLREICREGVDWIRVAQESYNLWAYVDTGLNIRDP
jgi:hypothetical protein